MAPTIALTGSGTGSLTATASLNTLTLTGTNNSIGGAGNLLIAAPIGESVGGSGFSKTGAGILTLSGAQTYATLTTSGGTTNLNAALGTGTSTVIANATTNFGASQTLAALTIGAGAVVTLTATPPFAPMGSEALSGPSSAVVAPEPGSIGLLLVGSLGLLARRRRD